ncbi:MAG: gamma-glutamyltransferase, partial [Gemmatimonadetes bacterium]|nr:gamma-glutamyltransferase [Gemmatimonadota bacterium]
MRPLAVVILLAACARATSTPAEPWTGAEQARYLGPMQAAIRSAAGSAEGRRGAVTVAYNAYAARAGLDVLQQGGNAMDAALTAALTQVATTAGSPVSYFGIMSLVYYDAKTRQVSTLWAGWNTVRGETSPLTIPGAISLNSDGEALGTDPSGRTALVGGFMKGVEAAHRRFGRRPFATLFDPAIRVAEGGMPVHATLAHQFELRAKDLARLPATRAALLKPDGSAWQVGDTLRQAALAATLRQVAANGADYMYNGPWGERLVAAVQADGGKMTMEDLRGYEVIWSEPLRATVHGHEIVTAGAPNTGGAALIEAQQLAVAAGLPSRPHWSADGEALRRAVQTSMGFFADLLPPAALGAVMPGIDFSPAARLTPEHGAQFWAAMEAGKLPVSLARQAPRHSDDVVVVDAEGNMAAITHSINCVYWGKTALNIDGISIGDPGSYQQALIARV